MSLSDEEIEKMIDDLDEGHTENIPDEVRRDHQLIKDGVEYIQEDSFRKKLEQAEKSMRKSTFLNTRFYVTSGIAACLALALFWYNGNEAGSDAIDLQMDEVPAYADSATYDSLQNRELEVDKIEE